ncbi:MAG: aminoglycoside phosphotransferase family protein [Deltaproteobacteria bacterium]|nr:aminoglycoside phosphotransferase family protein [Deltaproteobacteria bacterium]
MTQTAADLGLMEVAAQYGLNVKEIREDLLLAGSPDRTESRYVVEDDRRELFVLETIHRHTRPHKQRIIDALDELFSLGIPGIHPYLRTAHQDSIIDFDGKSWQCSPYISGCELNRPGYLHEAWRGEVIADFLINLHQKASRLTLFKNEPVFSLVKFIEDFVRRLERHDPKILDSAQKALAYVSRTFFPVHDDLPVSFCHGDVHPINIIWGERNILAVIDWEFLGFKPEGYDLANLIGCLGMEHPRGLQSEFLERLLQRIFGGSIYASITWRYLFELVIATRFAWLSVWLHKKDSQMVELELDYLNLLVEHEDLLKNTWQVTT